MISTERIQQELASIEKEKQVKILLACETGSRAWGIASTDSDYDVRLIYAHHLDWYLSLNSPKDSFERMLENNELDISGWDLKKTLGLIWKSNATLLERIQSPIVYQQDAAFVEGFRKLADQCYSRVGTLHHYLGMARKYTDDVQKEPRYRLKKLFYALRTATASKWIVEREEIPPIVFSQMLDGLGVSHVLRERVAHLVTLKTQVGEGYLHEGEAEVMHFINACIDQAQIYGPTLPSAKGDLEAINQFFRQTLKRL